MDLSGLLCLQLLDVLETFNGGLALNLSPDMRVFFCNLTCNGTIASLRAQQEMNERRVHWIPAACSRSWLFNSTRLVARCTRVSARAALTILSIHGVTSWHCTLFFYYAPRTAATNNKITRLCVTVVPRALSRKIDGQTHFNLQKYRTLQEPTALH